MSNNLRSAFISSDHFIVIRDTRTSDFEDVLYDMGPPNVIQRWITTEIGKEEEDWAYSKYFDRAIWLFKREEDKVKFILKWL